MKKLRKLKKLLVSGWECLHHLCMGIKILYVDLKVKSSVEHRRIKQFRGLHEGQRCFIIGNGPSLDPADLDRISVPSFSSNRIGLLLEKTRWNPFYYSGMDTALFRDNLEEVEDIEAKAKFFVSLELEDNYHYIKRFKKEFIWLWSRNIRSENGAPSFSDDLQKIIVRSGTITFINIQLAVYMGFKEIYLLGVDNQYVKEKTTDGSEKVNEHMAGSSYFKGYDPNGSAVAVNTEKMTAAYISAKRYCDQHGIKIYNATRGGALEVFPRVDFDSLFDEDDRSIVS